MDRRRENGDILQYICIRSLYLTHINKAYAHLKDICFLLYTICSVQYRKHTKATVVCSYDINRTVYIEMQ